MDRDPPLLTDAIGTAYEIAASRSAWSDLLPVLSSLFAGEIAHIRTAGIAPENRIQKGVPEHLWRVEAAKLFKGNRHSSIPRDVPLGELQLATNGTQLFVEFAKRNPTLTLTEAVAKQAGGEGRAYVGTPDIVASRLAETMQQVGGDGFLIGTNGLTRRQIAEICDGLVPELQRRGLTRRAYEHATLRENLKSF